MGSEAIPCDPEAHLRDKSFGLFDKLASNSGFPVR